VHWFLLILICCQSLAGTDWAAQFELIAKGRGGSLDRHLMVVRHGRRMDAMVLVAPVTIRAPLGGLFGNLTFECLAAPVYFVGVGMQMDVLLKNEAGEHLVYTRYFDAGRHAEDRDWTLLSIPLDLPDASTSEIIIRLSGGPQGDLVADWLALASVRLMRRTQSP